MKIFTTYYEDEEGVKWSGKCLTAINWDDAEMQAKDLGLTVRGQLYSELDCADNGKPDWKTEVFYNNIQHN